MEGDAFDSIFDTVYPISTHALTWRATGFQLRNYIDLPISTHALTWRATAKADKIIKERWDFYPRPHMEGDGRKHGTQRILRQHFYPRPHMEGDEMRAFAPTLTTNFYPRPHMEGDS